MINIKYKKYIKIIGIIFIILGILLESIDYINNGLTKNIIPFIFFIMGGIFLVISCFLKTMRENYDSSIDIFNYFLVFFDFLWN